MFADEMPDLFAPAPESEAVPPAAEPTVSSPAPAPPRRQAHGRAAPRTAKAAHAFSAYARIAVDQPVDQAFTYGIPADLHPPPRAGSLVAVPFGGRQVRGCVLELSPEPPEEIAPSRIKPVFKVLSPGFHVDPPIISLALWMAEYYMCAPGEAIACVSFLGLNDIGSKTVTRYSLADPGAPASAPSSERPADEEAGNGQNSERKGQSDKPAGQPRALTPKQKAVLECLAASGPRTAEELQAAVGASADTLRRLVARGLIDATDHDIHRADDYDSSPPPDRPLNLNPAQTLALDRIRTALNAREPRTFLLHGVTGSGKTEVYLQAIDHALRSGGSAIVLVPEISLTPQTVGRFRSRFGDVVGVYHSKLTLGQKFDLWKRVKSGHCRIMVGARSAVFTPFADCRMIVVDEEHETSYKQETAPRYHARDMAIVRAQRDRAAVILGSATPSIETYFKAQSGKFELLHLPDRVDHASLPEIRIVDMTQEAKENKNPSLLSRPLYTAMESALARGEQVLLFLNRRGFFNFMVCLACQTAVQCRHCAVALTHHKPRNNLMCHYCGRVYSLPSRCPGCESAELSMIGIGTQRVEETVSAEFPQARVIRMDLDTTRRRNAFLEAWRKIESGQVDVILGTQMIAKGIHLEQVTVVGVPLADVSLFQPDFRAAERAFAVLTQVAGRAGRGEKPGTVYIQTYVPHHYAIGFARTHDYRGFYDKEIRVRQVLRFPPHYRLIGVLAVGPDAESTAEKMKEFANLLRNVAFRARDAVTVLGPVPAAVAKIKDQWRWRLILRGTEPSLMRQILRDALARYRDLPGHSRVQMLVDVDPQDLL